MKGTNNQNTTKPHRSQPTPTRTCASFCCCTRCCCLISYCCCFVAASAYSTHRHHQYSEHIVSRDHDGLRTTKTYTTPKTKTHKNKTNSQTPKPTTPKPKTTHNTYKSKTYTNTKNQHEPVHPLHSAVFPFPRAPIAVVGPRPEPTHIHTHPQCSRRTKVKYHLCIL